MAEPVVSFAVERLGDLLIEEFKFLSGVSDQFEEIKVELKRMQCFLKDADQRQDENESVRNWIAEIRDLAFKTENVIERYAVEIASKREGRDIKTIMRRFACIIGEGISLHKVGSEIKKIKNEIVGLTTSLDTYGIKKGEGSSFASHKELFLRAKYPHKTEDDFVGMKKDEEQIVSHLSKNDGVITIKGMGGQGKTTMATRIYNRADVRRSFNSFAWVCVTQQCEKKIIWQDILKQLAPERMTNVMQMGDIQLAEALYKVQEEKKCLVVLDDIWSTEDWISLNPAFPVRGAAVGSKLFLTTRTLDAKVGRVHLLGGLNEDEGWELLQKKAFIGEDDHAPGIRVGPEMIKLGREMVRKCGGLPLAISVLGGFLKDKTTLREWEEVHENMISHLRGGERIEDNYQTVTQVLALSYNDLPYFLKPCFLYFGCFPEDSEIDVEMLCLLWIAEGFISPAHKGEGEIMLDVAERYMDELARRSMVQVKLMDHYSFTVVTKRFESCRLHDLMRDMCALKGENEDFVKMMDYRSMDLDDGELSISMNSCPRRLSFHLNDDTTTLKIPRKQHETIQRAGSLLLNNKPHFIYKSPLAIPGINEFKFLRVLDIKSLYFIDDKDLERISELIHLRHLSFADCSVKKFPSSISTLRYLQTLDLRVRGEVIIPNTLGRMKPLRHLFLPDSFCLKGDQKLRLNGLLQLELLFNFDPTKCNLEDVAKLNKLGFFNSIVRNNLEDLMSIIKYLNSTSSRHLRKTALAIESSKFSSVEAFYLLEDLFGCLNLQVLCIDGPINKLPKSNHHLKLSSSLTIIWLWRSELKEDPMEILEKLPNLDQLNLSYSAFAGKEMVCSSNGFPKLRFLELYKLTNMERWHVEDGAMPNLVRLILYQCEKLEKLPSGLKFLNALKELEIKYMPKAFEDRVRVVNGVEGEDFDNVRHVPSIKFSS